MFLLFLFLFILLFICFHTNASHILWCLLYRTVNSFTSIDQTIFRCCNLSRYLRFRNTWLSCFPSPGTIFFTPLPTISLVLPIILSVITSPTVFFTISEARSPSFMPFIVFFAIATPALTTNVFPRS